MMNQAARIDYLSFTTIALTIIYHLLNKKHKKNQKDDENSTYDQLIGNTPIIHLKILSRLIGSDIYVKMENANPAGTGKDRAVKYMLNAAKKHPNYKSGVDIVEGTSGSTGIALAFQCNALGLKLHVVLPDDQAEEKKCLLEKLGASVTIVPTCAIANKNHYVHRARQKAEELSGIFIDQFENDANWRAHYENTGPEIISQLGTGLDAFVMGSGTGGTIAGVSRYFKDNKFDIKIVLADPTGSSLYHKVLYDVCYTPQQAERKLKKHRYDSIVEGVGLDRITKNFEKAKIDFAECVPDQEIVDIAHWILKHEGLFLGSSSALNVAAAVRTARKLGKGEKILTVVCDSGNRHLSRFWNSEYLSQYGLNWPESDVLPDCLK